ncbi:MAG: OB-fold nucleic acid binding domain-containing protein, partial [Flavobacteriales bacterium]
MSKKTMLKLNISSLLSQKPVGETIEVKAWIRTHRNSKNVSFIAINDGSCLQNIQVVLENETDEDVLKRLNTGASIAVQGLLVESSGKGQSVEIQANKIEIIGDSDASTFPIQPKRHSLEFLREKA